MCVGQDGMLHVPSASQLEMHVGADDVERLVNPTM